MTLFNLSSSKPTGYPILIQITIHPLSTDGAIVIWVFLVIFLPENLPSLQQKKNELIDSVLIYNTDSNIALGLDLIIQILLLLFSSRKSQNIPALWRETKN